MPRDAVHPKSPSKEDAEMAVKRWWDQIPAVWKVVSVIAAVAVAAFGAGVQFDFITDVPRTVRENRSMLLALDTVLAEHAILDAHPEEKRARVRGDSILLEAITENRRAALRGDSLIIETLQWTVCIERLDRRQPNLSPSAAARACPPPGAIQP